MRVLTSCKSDHVLDDVIVVTELLLFVVWSRLTAIERRVELTSSLTSS